MMKLNRRTLLKATAAGAAISSVNILRYPADAAEFNYKFANNWVETHPLNVRGREAVKKIKEESGGQLDIRIFPNNQLGGDTDMLSQIRSGAIQFFTESGQGLATLVPVTSLYGMAFAFHDYDHAWAAMDGKLGDHLRDAVRKAGLVAFDKNWDNGFRHFISGPKPLNTPEDLKGFKIRVPVGPLWTSTFEALGASPTSINFSELYSALQTKIVDGAENSLIGFYSAKLYEVQKYVALTSYQWDNYFFLANRRSFEALPKKLQDIASSNFNAAGLKERADIASMDSTLEGTLKEKGLEFSRPDPQPFRAALQKAGFYKQWREKFGEEAWALLEEYSGKLA
jgi:tripartite ATP-independent transporter DctP family solute receptor